MRRAATVACPAVRRLCCACVRPGSPIARIDIQVPAGEGASSISRTHAFPLEVSRGHRDDLRFSACAGSSITQCTPDHPVRICNVGCAETRAFRRWSVVIINQACQLLRSLRAPSCSSSCLQLQHCTCPPAPPPCAACHPLPWSGASYAANPTSLH